MFCWLINKKNGGSRFATYCTQVEFSSGSCTIENSIIKTQWLNNIISFDGDIYQYLNIAINSKGDMIVEASVDGGDKRYLYGLKSSGRYYFTNNGNGVSNKIISAKISYNNSLLSVECDVFFAKMKENKNEET